MRKYGIHIFVLSFWLLSLIFIRTDTIYLKDLNTPWFMVPPIIFNIITIIALIYLTSSIIMIYKKCKFNTKARNYYLTLLINYVVYQLYRFFIFVKNNLAFSFLTAAILFVSSFYLYYETKKEEQEASRLLKPYIWLNTYILILTIIIYLLNY